MAVIDKLRWESEVDENGIDWVEVSPPTGYGDTQVEIIITNSTHWADPNTLESEITFRCLDCDDIDEDERVKKIHVCRCSCDCDSFEYVLSNISQNVTEEGLPAETVIGYYGIMDRCDEDYVSAELVKDSVSVYPLDCSNGEIKLIYEIPHTQSASETHYTVNVYFDRIHLSEACSSFTFIQDSLECDCASVVLGNITYSNYFNGSEEIPQTGLTVGTEIFTYNLKQYCPAMTAKIKYGVSTTIDLIIENGSATLSRKIGPNTNSTKRDIKLEVWYNNEEEPCDVKYAKQTEKICSCEDITFTKIN